MISALTGEKKVQLARRDMVQGRLKKEAPSWMVRQSETGPQGEGLNMFVQSCIFPRVLFSQSADGVTWSKAALRFPSMGTASTPSAQYQAQVCEYPSGCSVPASSAPN